MKIRNPKVTLADEARNGVEEEETCPFASGMRTPISCPASYTAMKRKRAKNLKRCKDGFGGVREGR